jgi:hypothetical protein
MKKSFLGLLALLLLSTTSFQLRAAAFDDESGEEEEVEISAQDRENNQKRYNAHVERGFVLLASEKYWEMGKQGNLQKIQTPNDLIAKMNKIGDRVFGGLKKSIRTDVIEGKHAKALETGRLLGKVDDKEAESLEDEVNAGRVIGGVLIKRNLGAADPMKFHSSLEPSSSHVKAEDPSPEELVGDFFAFTPKPLENFLKLSKSSE